MNRHRLSPTFRITKLRQGWKHLAPLLLLLALLPGLQEVHEIPRGSRRSGIEPPITTTLTWNGQPGLGRTVTLIAQVSLEVQAENLTIRWVLPTGVILSGPDTDSLGTIAAGQTVVSQRDITFDQTGTFKVAVGAQMESLVPQATWSAADLLYITVRRGLGSGVSRHVPKIATVEERIDTPEVHYAPASEPASPRAGYFVRGRFGYEDRPISASGPGSAVVIPARRVKVEIWEDDLIFDDYEGSTRTDDDGYFSFWVSDNDDGLLGGDKETFLTFHADTPGGSVTNRYLQTYRVRTGSQRGGHDIDFGTVKPKTYDPMFNIADVLLDARNYVDGLGRSLGAIRVRYEPGFGQDGSYFNPILGEIVLADSPDADAYDDTVILHEYGHYVARMLGCDHSLGGEHSVYKHYSKELAWSEGWANYFSSAARNSPWYLDWNWNTGQLAKINWETWTVTGSTNEGAVCATLWDLDDHVDETHDRLSLGVDEIWDTFHNRMRDPRLECDIFAFWDEWLAAGHPDDSELAAVFAHHATAGLQPSVASGSAVQAPSVPVYSSAAPVVQAAADSASGDSTQPSAVAAPDTVIRGGVPWNAILFLVDATSSMTDEISAVKQIIQDKIDALDAEPNPYEYIVETFQDNGENTPVTDHFFPDVVNDPIAGITVSGGGGATEDSFAALARGTTDRPGYDAWLFTDAAPNYEVGQAQLQGLLQSHEVTPYFFLFGDCTAENTAVAEQPAEIRAPRPPSPGSLHLPSFAPQGLEECVESYLPVATATNGQFLFIDTSQMGDAIDIVRALMSNNAGSGRFSDYVSSDFTYTWEDISYDWYDASGGTSSLGAVSLPKAFAFYGTSHNTIYVNDPGYVSFASYLTNYANTSIPTTSPPNNAIYAFWDDVSTIPYEAHPTVTYYTEHDTANDRFVIEFLGAYHKSNNDNLETFEILLDFATGEIILQYAQVTDDSSCTVGVENAVGTGATQIIYNNPGGLYDGRAIKLSPKPPQPTRDHEVVVDSTMGGVVFLLNGYSGTVNLIVYDPDGTPINPTDPGVTFLDVGKIKYYRVNNPQVGTWIARASGEGTYYFTSAAASPLVADYLTDATLGSTVAANLTVDLGMPVASADFSLVYPDGSLFDDLDLYDDGNHGDLLAGDGIYGGSYTPSGPGTFYLRVDGQLPAVGRSLHSEGFRRSDPIPIRFQQMRLVAPTTADQFAQPGDTVVHTLSLYNDGPQQRQFYLEVDSSQGWASAAASINLLPSQSAQVPVTIQVPPDAARIVEQTFVTARCGDMADTAVVATTVRGPADRIDLNAYPNRIAPNGAGALIVAQVADDTGWSVADGTEVTFETTLGTLDSVSGTTVDGHVTTTLTSGAAAGMAQVQATAGSVTEMITVEISIAPAFTLTVQASPESIPASGITTSRLTAHVYDIDGNPAPDGSQIVFGVEGDDKLMGSIEGQEVYTTTTSGGVATATYHSGTTAGQAIVRAGIQLGDSAGVGEGLEDVRWTETTIELTSVYTIYLPVVVRGHP